MIFFNIAILILILGILYYFQRIHVSFNKRVFIALILGGTLGIFMHNFYSKDLIDKTMDIYSVVSVGYIRFLQMLIYPVVSVATLSAMTKIGDNSKIGKSLVLIIFILIATTATAAVVGIFISLFFNLNLDSLSNIVADPNIITSLGKREAVLDRPLYTIFTDFISTNPFADFAGLRATSIASLVIFLIMVGFAYLGVKRKEPAIAEKFKAAVDVLYKIVMRFVVLILRLTPYGIFAIFCKITATVNTPELLSLLNFLLLSYLAIIIMFLVHTIMIMCAGFNIITYYKKVFSLLVFAFISRSSAASIPININTQIKQLGVSDSIATTGASFGAVVGQNGCAGIYPAMLAIAVAPSVGINPLDVGFLLSLVAVIAISSFGIAGIGGGATFAAIAVFSVFHMPVTVVALLVGIEPIIDMARTTLNVNGSVTASLITAKVTKDIDMNNFNNLNTLNIDNEDI